MGSDCISSLSLLIFLLSKNIKKAIICHIIAVNNITFFSFLIIWVFCVSFSICHLRIFILRLRVNLLTEDQTWGNRNQ